MIWTSTRGWDFLILLLFTPASLLVDAHFFVTYPKQREYTYHNQFQFPCGGAPPAVNRSAWPTNGGAISFIPIHAFGLTTINIALGNNIDENIDTNPYNVQMVPMFNQTGSNSTFCLPTVKIPKKLAGQISNGVNATIQVIQLVGTGASLYSCMDITFNSNEANRFAEPAVWDHFCFNGTGMGARALGVSGSLNGSTSGATSLISPGSWSSSTSPLAIAITVSLWWML